MNRLPDRENTNFPLAVANALAAVNDEKFLMRHQVMPFEFFTKYPKARGLLFAHETGLGKSVSGAAIADEFIKSGVNPICIIAKTLQNNFKENILKYRLATTNKPKDEIIRAIDRDYAFVSANANNMLAQLKNASAPIEMQEILDSEAAEREPLSDPSDDKSTQDHHTWTARDIKDREYNTYLDSINLEGRLVIVDEAHHFFNGIVSGSKNARGLYEIIMHTKEIKVLFLTSNVITNTPFELVPCFNMIAGYELLPTLYQDFVDMFIEKKRKPAKDNSLGSTNPAPARIKNVDHFKSRIYGMTSYYGSWYESGGQLNIHSKVVRENLPTRLPIKEVFVPMSDDQYGAYAMAREKESQQKSFGTKKATPLSKPSSAGDSSYRIRSRQLSNFWQKSKDDEPKIAGGIEKAKIGTLTHKEPMETISDVLGEHSATGKTIKAHEKLDPNALKDLARHSPKFKAILENIKKHGTSAGLVFSSFVHTYGIEWFARALEAEGYSKYIIGDFEKRPRYAYITGDMTVEERSAVLFAFNSPENKNGEIIHLLLGSPAMSEGIDTKRIRHVHIMEALWHFSAIEQIIARAVRLHSHDDLPEDQRDVQPYIYLSDYPADAKRMVEPTTDIALYYKALRKKILNDQFFRALVETSIDCNVHIKKASALARKHIKCMMCAPTNKPLFDRDIVEDLGRPVACVQSIEHDVEVEEIKYMNKTFYYRRDPNGALHLYEYNEPTSSYVRLSPMSKWYTPLFKKLNQ